MSTEPAIPQSQKNDEDFDISPFLSYLKTKEGQEIATRVVAIFEELRKVSLDRSSSLKTVETYLRYVMVLAVIVAAVTLSLYDKFDSTIGVLFGTLIGYFFGRTRKS